jgi:hypothetical protein
MPQAAREQVQSLSGEQIICTGAMKPVQRMVPQMKHFTGGTTLFKREYLCQLRARTNAG